MFSEPMYVGYVVKRYPRYSETFIVREILAHEAAGTKIEIFALRPPNDRHFQDLIARVRAPVTYLYVPPRPGMTEPLPVAALTPTDFWNLLQEASTILPGLWNALEAARGEDTHDVYQAILLARTIRLKGIQHLHAPFAHTPATVARLAACFAGITYSFTARAKDIYHASVRPEMLERKLLDAGAVVTISDYNLRYLHQTFGPAAMQVQRIYNGLDLEQFPYTPPIERPPVILSVGRLVEKKGFGDLITACAMLAEREVPFICRILGAGPLKEELAAQIESLGLQERVELIGARPQGEVIRAMQEAAVFALPCIVCADGDRDGLPNVIFEAMALGTPVVSTDVTGIPEVLHHDKTGLMVAQNDPPALAEALERLLADPALRARLAAAARQLIEREFDAHRNAARRRALFQAAVVADRAVVSEAV